MRRVATRLLLAVPALTFAACGADEAQTSRLVDAGPLDGSARVDAGSDAAFDAADGCAVNEEGVRGTCLPVAPAGARRLATEVNPPEGIAYGGSLDLAKTVGVSVVPITLPWGTLLETAPPDAGTSNIATGWFTGISTELVPRNLALLLSIPLVDTVSIQAPADLVTKIEGGTPFDAPEVVGRYKKVIDAYFTTVDPSLELRYFVISNEVDVFFTSKPDSAWESLARFLVAIRDHVHATHPATKVGINVSFGGIADSVKRPKIAQLIKDADVTFVSYYFGANGFGAPVGTDVTKDFDAMLAVAGTKPLVLKELGYPTTITGHDEAGQGDFISSVFRTWDAHATSIPLVVVSRLYDGKRANCEAEAASYGSPGNEEFIRFLCSFGLHNVDTTPKPAWHRFREASKVRGF